MKNNRGKIKFKNEILEWYAVPYMNLIIIQFGKSLLKDKLGNDYFISIEHPRDSEIWETSVVFYDKKDIFSCKDKLIPFSHSEEYISNIENTKIINFFKTIDF